MVSSLIIVKDTEDNIYKILGMVSDTQEDPRAYDFRLGYTSKNTSNKSWEQKWEPAGLTPTHKGFLSQRKETQINI